MQIDNILNALISYGWLIPAIFLARLAKTPWFKGVFGEFIVNMYFTFKLDKDRYHLVKDITLPTEDGSTQIDHIIVSRYGIFVIETKNMRGWIFGTDKQAQWTQQIFKAKIKFQNPLRQNYKHTQTLQEVLELEADKVFSVIIFVGDTTFKTPMPPNVVQGIGAAMRYIQTHKALILSEDIVAQIVKDIADNRLERSSKTNKAHAEHVQDIIRKKQLEEMRGKSEEADE